MLLLGEAVVPDEANLVDSLGLHSPGSITLMRWARQWEKQRASAAKSAGRPKCCETNYIERATELSHVTIQHVFAAAAVSP